MDVNSVEVYSTQLTIIFLGRHAANYLNPCMRLFHEREDQLWHRASLSLYCFIQCFRVKDIGGSIDPCNSFFNSSLVITTNLHLIVI